MNRVQSFRAEVDSIDLLTQYLRLAITSCLVTEELAWKPVVISDRNYRAALPASFDDTKQLPILQISGWYTPKNGEEYPHFRGYKPWQTLRGNRAVEEMLNTVENVLLMTRKSTSEEFARRFGSGYSDVFNEFDGSVEMGYFVQTANCFPQQLIIGPTHIYYGK